MEKNYLFHFISSLPTAVTVSPDQHEKLKRVTRHGTSVTVKVRMGGDHTVLLTRAQIGKLHAQHKVSIRFSKKQVAANVQHQGGFLGMLAGLATKALPTLLGGVASGLLSKAIGGDGLYLHKSGHCVKVEPIEGNGLYLKPYARLNGVSGDGLYLKHGSRIYDGQGLLFGSNSPFKNIPILNLLL